MSWSSEDEERLRRSLHDEASRVVPDSDALERIRERTRRLPWWRRPFAWSLATATAVAALTVAVGVTLNLDGNMQPDRAAITDELDSTGQESGEESGDESDETAGDDTIASSPPSGESSDVPDDVPRADASVIMTVPAYFLTETPAGHRLAREFRGVPDRDDAAEAALAVMFAGPVDPDYTTPWDPETEFSVTETDDAIEVALTVPEDGDPVPEELGELAVHQLVYTVQAALQRTDPVHILLDGRPADELWGVDVSDGVTRAPQLEVRQLVQINDPTEGMAVSSPVGIGGEAALFEATYQWRIEQNGVVVDEGFGQTEAGQRFSPFSFEVDLDPGEYEVIVTATDPSGGEGPGPMSDSRTFTVTE
ncbi:MAG TPA: Gmad2 immunoglobulin-like domain-containing protein [Jiangellaceae bacterium]